MFSRTDPVSFARPCFIRLLVANDNNYPATGGRGKDVKDNNQMIWLKLPTALTLAAGVGETRK